MGNTDRETVVKHGLKEGIRARYIRFRPTAWHKHISMRVEVYGCNGNIIGFLVFVENFVCFSRVSLISDVFLERTLSVFYFFFFQKKKKKKKKYIYIYMF